jgi:hypothetical protein
MVRSKPFLIALVALFLLAACGQFKFFSPSCVGENCVASASKGDAKATPTPVPTPTPTPLPGCRIGWLAFDKGPTALPLNGSGEYEFSPWQKVIKDGKEVDVKVDDTCNTGPREERIVWSVSTPAGVVVVGESRYSAKVTRKGTGAFKVKVTLDGLFVEREVVEGS